MSQSSDPDAGTTGFPAPDPDLGAPHASGDPLLGGGTVGASGGGITGSTGTVGDPLPAPVPGGSGAVGSGASTTTTTTTVDTGSDAGSKAEVAKEAAGAAKESAKNVAGEAKQQATALVSEATGHARGVIDSTLSSAREQGDQQATRAASGLRTFSDQARALSEGRTDEAGRLGEFVTRASDQASSLAGRLESGGLQGLTDDVSRFARRRPGLFLAAAAGLGFVAGRALRANQAAKSDDDEYTSSSYGTSYREYRDDPTYATTSYGTSTTGGGAGLGALPTADVASGLGSDLGGESRFNTGAR